MPLNINGSMVSFKLDTGAQVNVLPRSTYQKLHRKPPLKPTQSRILAYGSSMPLPLDGQCVCKIQHYNGVSGYLRFFVLAGNAEPILGLSACEQLSLIRRLCSADLKDTPISPENPPSLVHQEVAVEDPLASDFSELFQGVGLLEKHPYTIQLKEGAEPHAVACPRRVLYPLLEKVHDELQRMQDAGVIQEVIEPTEWVSPT